jgi:hypothetical protein
MESESAAGLKKAELAGFYHAAAGSFGEEPRRAAGAEG